MRPHELYMALFLLLLSQWVFSDLRGGGTVRLSDIQNGSAMFSALDCPGCGSTAKVRTGRIGKCGFCGCFLAAPIYNASEGQSISVIQTDTNSSGKNLQDSTGESFFDREAISKIDGRKAICNLIGGFVTVVGVFNATLLFSLGDDLNMALQTTRFLLAVGILPLLLGKYYSSALRLTELCSPLLGQWQALSITWGEIANSIGWKEKVVKKTFSRLFAWKVMKCCQAQESGLFLADPAHQAPAFIRTTCKNCGAEIRIKRGFVSVCRLCVSYLDEQGISHKKTGDGEPVVLTYIGPNRGAVLACLHGMLGMSLPEIEELIALTPVTIARTTSKGAEIIREELRRLGADAE